MSSGGGTSHWVGHITGPVGGNAIVSLALVHPTRDCHVSEDLSCLCTEPV